MRRSLTVLIAAMLLTFACFGQQDQKSSNSTSSYIVGILPFSDTSGNTDIGSLAQALPKLLQSALADHSSLIPRQLGSTPAKGEADSDPDDSSAPAVDTASAAALGKAKRADLVLTGQILSANVETKDGSYSGPTIGGFSMSSKSRSQKSTIVLQINVIDVGRGQQIGSFRATGSDNERKIDPSASSNYGSMDMSSTGFQNSSLGKATEQALSQLTTSIVATAAKFTPAAATSDDSSATDKSTKSKTADDSNKAEAKSDTKTDTESDDKDSDDDKSATPTALDGLVADVNGKTLILNVGKKNGVQVGDQLKVGRTTREIKDPATGNVIRKVDSPLGTVKIIEVEDNSSEGTYAGAAGVKVGDHVKR